jgi:short-subunit dehydrogenase
VAIFGATSDIAFAVARQLAAARSGLVLVGRNKEALEAAATDLRIRGALDAQVVEADLSRTDCLTGVVESAWAALGGLDVALIAYGTLPNQAAAESDTKEAEQALLVNFVSPALLCNALANKFEAHGSGTIAVITSVAGDRGRKSNLIYGAAKGGLQRFLEGLRHRLYAGNVTVLDIRPGFVATKMTAALVARAPSLFASPEQVAKDIVKALRTRQTVLYTPWFWRYIMFGIRNVPAPLFHRTRF